ncbi:MAG: ComF family protein [Clostridia bacterium]|nr:ComF family protein [Clostridia bacterium]
MKIQEAYNNFKNLIFTRRCTICGDVCDVRKSLCGACEDGTFRIEGDVCEKCGAPKKACVCRSAPFYMSSCAPFVYEGGPQKAIFLMKYKNDLTITESLAAEMAECVKKRYSGYDFDCVTFVPAHKTDVKRRGYNQAERLAKMVARKLDLPCYELVKKDFHTAPQHSLPAHLRTGNLAGALSYNAEAPCSIEHMRILLCDDLKTTGSTLNESAKILLFKGAAEIRCVTACIKLNK